MTPSATKCFHLPHLLVPQRAWGDTLPCLLEHSKRLYDQVRAPTVEHRDHPTPSYHHSPCVQILSSFRVKPSACDGFDGFLRSVVAT